MFETRITELPGRFADDTGFDIRPFLEPGAPNLAQLVANATSCSPFLRSVAQANAEWVGGLANQSPEDAFFRLLREVLPEASADRARRLRIARSRLALLAALADLGGVWSLREVMMAMTRFADFAVQKCLQSVVMGAHANGELRGPDLVPPEHLGGMFVLAMGKMGAHELNYSSDIDLIILFDDRWCSERELPTLRNQFVRVTRRFVSLMSTATEDGFVFRTDLRLRPDPLVAPVCLSCVAAERYYESFGRTWERAAFIKARPCAGHLPAASEFLATLEPFVWRRSLDFASIEDARNMRRMIRQQAEHEPAGSGGSFNLKLGGGGIRDIEMMTQTFQIVAGGRDRALRCRDALSGLTALGAQNWIDEDVRNRLAAGYVQLRRIEHRLQMINDSQTHSIPKNATELQRVAAICGQDNPEVFVRGNERLLFGIKQVTEDFFAPVSARGKDAAGDGLSPASRGSIERWRDLPALRNERANAVFARIQPLIIDRLLRSRNPDQAIAQFEGFLAGLPAGAQLFSLFESNPVLIDLLTDICGTAPGLALYLSRNSHVFDAVLDGDFFEMLPPVPDLTAKLRARLATARDFEAILDIGRRWMKDHRFRVGVQHLRGHIGWDVSAECYSSIAEAVLKSIWDCVVKRFSARHGQPPGRGAAVIGMGSLGAGVLTAQSDLDLLVVFEPGAEDFSSGPTPLPSRLYFARQAMALVSALSAQTAEGRLYAIDMRLRPSGNQGPVATTVEAFGIYQDEKAWTWEHMALTRARYVAGAEDVGRDFETIRRKIIAEKGDRRTVTAALDAMRARLAENLPCQRDRDPWEVRLGPGRLLDIELVVQPGALFAGEHSRLFDDQLAAGVQQKWFLDGESTVLKRSYATLRQLLQVARLTVESSFRPDLAGEGALAFLMRETGEDSIENLLNRLQRERNACRAAIQSIMNRHRAGGN